MVQFQPGPPFVFSDLKTNISKKSKKDLTKRNKCIESRSFERGGVKRLKNIYEKSQKKIWQKEINVYNPGTSKRSNKEKVH